MNSQNFLSKRTNHNIRILKFIVRDIINFLIENNLWLDISIYANKTCFTSIKPNMEQSDYNTREILTEHNSGIVYYYKDEASNYTQYCNGLVTMIFEGPLYHVLNYYDSMNYCNEIIMKFEELLKRYGLYYELGNAWNLGLYEISEGSFIKTLHTRVINSYSGWHESYERLFNQHN